MGAARVKFARGHVYSVWWDDHGLELAQGPGGSSERNIQITRGYFGAIKGRYVYLWVGNPVDKDNLEGNVDRYKIIRSQIVAVHDWGDEDSVSKEVLGNA